TLAAAGADRSEAEATAVAAQLVDHRRDDAAAGGADRMAERDRAAGHVRLVGVGAEHLYPVEPDRRERLADLDPLYVVDRLAGPRERLLAGLRGRTSKVGEVVGHVALREDRRERLQASALGELLRADDDAAGPVVDARRVAGGCRSLGIEDRL